MAWGEHLRSMIVVHVEPAEGIIPGLFNVQWVDGTWSHDLTVGQVRSLCPAWATAGCPVWWPKSGVEGRE